MRDRKRVLVCDTVILIEPDEVGRVKNPVIHTVILRSEATKNLLRVKHQGILRHAKA
jgi:hypothetical protein